MPFLLLLFIFFLLLSSLFLYFFLFYFTPPLQDDWPRVASCKVKERSGTWPSLPPNKRQYVTNQQYQTLCALCDTILPAFEEEGVEEAVREYLMGLLGTGDMNKEERELLFQNFTKDKVIYTRGALDAEVPLGVLEVLETCVLPDARKNMKMVFHVLEMPIGLLILTGRWYGWGSQGAFSSMSFERREDVIQRLLTSYIVPIRGVSYFHCAA
jgi:hypothetical protein